MILYLAMRAVAPELAEAPGGSMSAIDPPGSCPSGKMLAAC